MANFKLPALVSGFSCRQTQGYGSMELCLLWRLPRTRYNDHGRAEPVQSLYVTKVPSVPGILMSKFTRCSHSFLRIHINSFIFRKTYDIRNPSSLAPRMFFQHLATSLTLPYFSAAQSWFIALFAFTAVPLLSSLSQLLVLPQSHPRL